MHKNKSKTDPKTAEEWTLYQQESKEVGALTALWHPHPTSAPGEDWCCQA